MQFITHQRMFKQIIDIEVADANMNSFYSFRMNT